MGSELHYNRSPVFTTYCNDVITTHVHINDWVAAAAEIEKGEDMKSAYSVWKKAESSEVIKSKVNGVEPIELAKFGVDSSECAG